jgi:energy-coupling factor transporter ATP-binding protein EcfA2
MIQVEKLNFAYGNSQGNALSEMSFTIGEGEIFGF